MRNYLVGSIASFLTGYLNIRGSLVPLSEPIVETTGTIHNSTSLTVCQQVMYNMFSLTKGTTGTLVQGFGLENNGTYIKYFEGNSTSRNRVVSYMHTLGYPGQVDKTNSSYAVDQASNGNPNTASISSGGMSHWYVSSKGQPMSTYVWNKILHLHHLHEFVK